MERDRIRVTVPGYATEAPIVEGYEAYWVAHFGHDRTTFTYRRAG